MAIATILLATLLAGNPDGEDRGKTADAAGAAFSGPAASVPSSSVSKAWRAEKIRSIWNELHFGEPPLPDTVLGEFLETGTWNTVDSGATPLDYVLSGNPVLVPAPTGMLLAGQDGLYWPHCTVVLTAPDRVVTARHCIDSLPDRSDLRIHFPWEGIRGVMHKGISVFPGEAGEDGRTERADLARIRLDRPYRFIPLATPPATGAAENLVAQGFGNSNRVLTDRGLLLQGAVEPEACRCNGKTGSGVLCFEVRFHPGGQQTGRFANFGGHSGGPMFDVSNGEFSLIGIASKLALGCGAGGTHEGRYVDLSNPRISDWLSRSFCTPPCRTAAEGALHVLLRIPYARTGPAGVDRHGVSIPAGTGQLIITLNHEIDGFRSRDGADLEITPPARLAGFECTRHYGVENCEVQNPAPGDYSIGIKRVSGNPAYQLTAVAVVSER